MTGKFVIAICILSIVTVLVETKTDKVICYCGSWGHYRKTNLRYTPEDIDAHLCTHIIYTFLEIDLSGNLKILEDGQNYLERSIALKQKNPKLKTLIAVRGWNEDSSKYSAVVADPQKRATLIWSAVKILKVYAFDGFEINWEYPGQRGGASRDKANFATLLKEFRKVFDKKSFILSAAVGEALSYEVCALSEYLDFINVMAYNFHGPNDKVTGFNAPLYPSKADVLPSAKRLNVNTFIREWQARGADPQKIILGIPLFGKTFTLTNPNSHGVGAPVISAGSPGPYTQESGILAYLEICEFQKEGGWTVVWDNKTKTPFTYKGNQWVGYDNKKSIKLKVEYAKSMQLGGVMIWSLDTADFRGSCGNKYSILNMIGNILHINSENHNTRPAKSTPKDDSNKKTVRVPHDNSSKKSDKLKEGSDSKETKKSNLKPKTATVPDDNSSRKFEKLKEGSDSKEAKKSNSKSKTATVPDDNSSKTSDKSKCSSCSKKSKNSNLKSKSSTVPDDKSSQHCDNSKYSSFWKESKKSNSKSKYVSVPDDNTCKKSDNVKDSSCLKNSKKTNSKSKNVTVPDDNSSKKSDRSKESSDSKKSKKN